MYKIYCVGGKDLYTIPKQSIDVNIGGVINTKEKLNYPFLSSNLR